MEGGEESDGGGREGRRVMEGGRVMKALTWARRRACPFMGAGVRLGLRPVVLVHGRSSSFMVGLLCLWLVLFI